MLYCAMIFLRNPVWSSRLFWENFCSRETRQLRNQAYSWAKIKQYLVLLSFMQQCHSLGCKLRWSDKRGFATNSWATRKGMWGLTNSTPQTWANWNVRDTDVWHRDWWMQFIQSPFSWLQLQPFSPKGKVTHE